MLVIPDNAASHDPSPQPPAVGSAVTVVVVGTDHASRIDVSGLLAQSPDLRVIGEIRAADRAVTVVEALEPHVVLLDLTDPGHAGLAAVARLCQHTAVVVLMDDADSQSMHRAIRAGALGYLVHGQFSAAELSQAVRAAARGEARLTQRAMDTLVHLVRSLPDPDRSMAAPQRERLSQREIEVMAHIVRGAANSDIAHDLYLSEKTVRNHVNHIYAKLGVRNRAQAMASWLGTAV